MIYSRGYVFNHYRVEDQLKRIIRGGIIVGMIIVEILSHACIYVINMYKDKLYDEIENKIAIWIPDRIVFR